MSEYFIFPIKDYQSRECGAILVHGDRILCQGSTETLRGLVRVVAPSAEVYEGDGTIRESVLKVLWRRQHE